MSIDWTPYMNAKWTDKVDTTISKASLQKLSKQLSKLPKGFTLHPVVQRLLSERDKMTAGEMPMNWGYAETMAYASLSRKVMECVCRVKILDEELLRIVMLCCMI